MKELHEFMQKLCAVIDEHVPEGLDWVVLIDDGSMVFSGSRNREKAAEIVARANGMMGRKIRLHLNPDGTLDSGSGGAQN